MSGHSNGSAQASVTRKSRRRDSFVDAKVAVDLATAQTYSENVFLFVPNLIGERALLIHSAPRTPLLSHDLANRLRTRHSRRTLTPFHELSSKILHHRILYIMPSRCCRWSSRQGARADIKVWCSVGHGDR
ncbi:hypothetical protein JVT61DRAFT_2419 [Boletus reticuloceps]|uniref:Uncharacterized protein n=1 Tax=Boletus reticuloceps TaxID=495285 RepID=A0A8I3AB98_9AGAM|nr:hypothetical protein JVT61DRAFT_2419 [Boletus reticuloceps]